MDIHNDLKKQLNCFINKKDVPHIIFYGKSGCGKTEILNYFIKQIYKNTENYHKYTMFINCAHGKGIKFIRDELKFFAKTNIQQNNLLFKSIILSNADKLTIDAQSALRRCIEEFSHTTRFFILLEDYNNLLKPIISRFCSIYVSEPIIDNKLQNLHKYNLQKIYKNEEKNTNKRLNWLSKTIENKNNYINCKKTIQLIDILYAKAYSALDIIKVIRKTKKLEDIYKYKLLIHVDLIKKQIKDEKLLMLYILTLAFLRNNDNLENIQEM
jgi:DNA polymerase III delta prime subunit